MIALDTNILVRLITNDDPPAVERARALILAERGFVQSTVLFETVWVLRSSFGFGREAIVRAFAQLLDIDDIDVERSDRVRLALEATRSGLSLEDALHLAFCTPPRFATFDAALAKRAARIFSTPDVNRV